MTRLSSPKISKTPKAGRPQAGSAQEDARESLLKAAIPLFALKGFSGTSVKDIADKAGVNVSLVSYHFNGKEGLYLTCIENFGKNRLAATERILQPASTREELRVRLEMFIDDLMVWFDEEPELCQIVQREAEMGFKITKDIFEQTFFKIHSTFRGFVRTAQSKGLLRKDFDAEIASRFFFIGLINFVQKDKMVSKHVGVSLADPAFRKKTKSQLSRMFFEGLQP